MSPRLSGLRRRERNVKHGDRSPITDRVILVVEDDPDILDMVSAVLETRGARAVRAADAAAARSALAAQSFDALVLDWNLPGESGSDFLAWLHGNYPELFDRTLVITGRMMQADPVDAGGGRAVLAKPFRPAELIDALAALIGRGDDVSA